jgi:hypothetical protein
MNDWLESIALNAPEKSPFSTSCASFTVLLYQIESGIALA